MFHVRLLRQPISCIPSYTFPRSSILTAISPQTITCNRGVLPPTGMSCSYSHRSMELSSVNIMEQYRFEATSTNSQQPAISKTPAKTIIRRRSPNVNSATPAAGQPAKTIIRRRRSPNVNS
eukprot:Tbor_TRINITY_DN4690_c0_g1::TRINITY_DN4690_c0_g1_i3::g.14895::m.14895